MANYVGNYRDEDVGSGDYDLTIPGLTDPSFQPNIPQSTPITDRIAQVIVGILIFSAVASGSGYVTSLIGNKIISLVGANSSLFGKSLIVCGKGLTIAGEGCAVAGKYAFLSISVPVYTVTWVIPKWIITVAIPKMALAAHEYVLIPAINGVIAASKFLGNQILNLAQAVYTLVLEPFGQFALHVVKALYRDIVVPLMGHLKDLAMIVYEYVLEPFARYSLMAVQKLYEAIIIPIVDGVVRAATFLSDTVVQIAFLIYNHVVIPLVDGFYGAGKFLFHAILVPTFNAVVRCCEVLKDVIEFTVQKIFNIIVPIAEYSYAALKFLVTQIVIPTVNGLKTVVVFLAEKIYGYVLEPFGSMTIKAATALLKFLYNWTIIPVFNLVVKSCELVKAGMTAVAQVANTIFQNTIVPIVKPVIQIGELVIRGTGSLLSWSGHMTYRITKEIVEAIYPAATAVQKLFFG